MHQDTEEILTDNGAKFRVEVLRNQVLHGVSIRNTAPHISQSNGLVENANRVIKTALRRNIAANDTRPWPNIVDHILAIHRGTPHESTAPEAEGGEVPDDEVELLIVQAWRTNTEGELLGILFGKVEDGHLDAITDELLVFLGQLVDDLPLDILSRCDEKSGTYVLTRTLAPHLLWSTCMELDADNCFYPSPSLYLEIDVTDLTHWDPFIRRGNAIEASYEEEEEGEKSEEEELGTNQDDPDDIGSEEEESRSEEGGAQEPSVHSPRSREEEKAEAQRRRETAEDKRSVEESEGPPPQLLSGDPSLNPEPPREDSNGAATEGSGS
ncbi:hypothetical protein CBR_g27786 [Chara braunii]|uniref:Integrase catalytic domain-containing protein n=1 Tax=Chara braunii TaxID=69332 RepID=A0A388L8J4_CHABU|nr:hypothetical protein CBR_g27786 [Chara braunii]|eukprot:GBG78562.1 hypothetical protein CBR_g27786 [Chara braunii]